MKIGGRRVNNLRYADDTTLLAESKEDLLNLMERVQTHSAKAGLHLNLKKTKVMCTEELDEIILDGNKVEIVHDFNFLGSRIDDNGTCKGEIVRRQLL